MAAKKKPINPLAARERRAKIGAAIGGVLFLAVAAYEVPSMMKMLNQKPAPAATATTSGSSSSSNSGSLPLPNVAGSSGPTTAPKGELVDTDVPPTSAQDGLVAFSVFETKDVFRPQVLTSGTTASTSTSASSSSGSAATPAPTSSATSAPTTPAPPPPTTKKTAAPTPAAPTTTAPTPPVIPPTGTTPTSTTATTTTPAPPATRTVAISVNGKVVRVGVDDTFPSGSPVFRLVSWTKTSARIGIVGGSYAGGAATLTIRLGHAVTLENTTDGKRYQLELASTP